MLVLLLPLYLSIVASNTFYQPDTRQQLYFWLSANKSKINKIYVDDRDLVPVIEKLNIDVKKVGADEKVTGLNYYFISTEKYISVEKYFSTEEVNDVSQIDNLKRVLSIDNKGRKGPSIKVYAP